MDFTFKIYKALLTALLKQGYVSVTFSGYQNGHHPGKFMILRHDVERHYDRALKMAEIESGMNIKGTYYFRLLPRHFQPEIIKEIAEMGHEIGYHYDDLTQCKGDFRKAITRFTKNLQILREIAPVETICMDGSPLSRFDNKDLWKMVSYKDFGITGEPYFDTRFDAVFYLTDTGRRWDGWKVNVRDKVPQQQQWIKQGLIFHSTNNLIEAANKNRLPSKIMFTFHPQRWNDQFVPWLKELMWQNIKNMGKKILVQRQESGKRLD